MGTQNSKGGGSGATDYGFPSTPDFLNKIEDENAWMTLAHQPEDRAFARTQVVKVVIPSLLYLMQQSAKNGDNKKTKSRSKQKVNNNTVDECLPNIYYLNSKR